MNYLNHLANIRIHLSIYLNKHRSIHDGGCGM